jgi:hypothetical protein
MPINSNAAAAPFSYGPGNNKLGEVTDRVAEISNYLASSPVFQSDITNFGYLVTLPPVDPLPTGVPTGSIAMSGSGTTLRMYVYGYGAAGSTSAVSGWRSITTS